MRGTNLDRHLREKHPSNPTDPEPSDGAAWQGVDRVVRRRLWMIAAADLGLAAAVVVVVGPARAVVGGLAVAVAVVFLASLGAAVAGLLRAVLTLDDDTAQLRHSLGLGHTRVPLPARLEIGSLWVGRPDPLAPDGVNAAGIDTRAGTYLRLASGPRSINVGCRTSTDIRKHWTGPTAGSRRRSWDVTLDRAAFVELQYALAERGQLVVRAQEQ